MNPYRTERQSTVGAAFGFLLIGVAIVGVIVLLCMYPQILDSLALTFFVICCAILLVVIGIGIVSALLVLPMYAKKGVEYQTNISYSIDDVKDVSGKMEDKKE